MVLPPHGVLQPLSSLELGPLRCGDLDGLTGPGVPTLPGGTLRDAEGAEVYQLDLIALLKRLRDDIEDAVYGTGGVGLGYAGALG